MHNEAIIKVCHIPNIMMACLRTVSLVVIATFITSSSATKQDAYGLYNTLFDSSAYNPEIRPRINVTSEAINVSVGLNLRSLVEVSGILLFKNRYHTVVIRIHFCGPDMMTIISI